MNTNIAWTLLYLKLDCLFAIINKLQDIFGIDCRSCFHYRFDAEKALTKSRATASTSWIREIRQKVGKWIVAKVAQLTFPLHFSRLILDSLQAFYSRLSVRYISLHRVVLIKRKTLIFHICICSVYHVLLH